VEFQLKVEESPLLMEVGLAWSVTVGRAGAGAAAGGGAFAATGFLAQPKVTKAAASITSQPVQESEREARFMRILLSKVPM
jgi:hypothetical protein